MTAREDETAAELQRRFRRKASRTGIYPDMHRKLHHMPARERRFWKQVRAAKLRWRARRRAARWVPWE